VGKGQTLKTKEIKQKGEKEREVKYSVVDSSAQTMWMPKSANQLPNKM